MSKAKKPFSASKDDIRNGRYPTRQLHSLSLITNGPNVFFNVIPTPVWHATTHITYECYRFNIFLGKLMEQRVPKKMFAIPPLLTPSEF